jgi:hypothetical protein
VIHYCLFIQSLMMNTFTVALLDASNLPTRERIEAEARFARELERVLGGTEFVAETYRAWIEVSESDARQIDRDTAVNASHWPVAMNAAMLAGFSKLGDIGEAHFEVRLERHGA